MARQLQLLQNSTPREAQLTIMSPVNAPRPRSGIIRKRTPRNYPIIDLLDIGHGRAERISARARKYPKKFFVGIDTERRAIIPSRQHNVKLLLGNAEARLRSIPRESVKMINMDFFPLVEIELAHEHLSPTRMTFGENIKPLFPDLFKQAMRALIKNGRLVITVPSGGVNAVDTALGASGILDYAMHEVPQRERNTTEDMAEHFRLAASDADARPWRIIVTKRIGPVKKTH